MGAGRDPVPLFFAVVGGLIWLGLAMFAPWSPWLSLLPVLLIAVVAVGVWAVRRGRASPSPELPPLPVMPPPPPPMERREYRVSNVALPSREPDYDFLFSATVVWTPLPGTVNESNINPEGLAVDAIIKRARAVTERYDPGRASLVQHELGAVLGTMRPDASGHVQAMAKETKVVLPDADRDRLDALAAVRKSRAVWEHERSYEQSKRAYLSEDVLRDIGSAVTWWLAKNDEQVEKVVRDIPLLVSLSTAVNGKKPAAVFAADGTSSPNGAFSSSSENGFPNSFPNGFPFGDGFPSGEDGFPSGNDAAAVADRFDALVRTLDFPTPEVNPLFIKQVACMIGQYGRPDAAQEIVRRFGTSIPADPPGGEPDDSTGGGQGMPPEGTDSGD